MFGLNILANYNGQAYNADTSSYLLFLFLQKR